MRMGEAKKLIIFVVLMKIAVCLSCFVGWSSGGFRGEHTAFVAQEDPGNPLGRFATLKRVNEDPFLRLAAWDGQWYLDIANRGYVFENRTPHGPPTATYAFFPAFPALSALLGSTGLGPLIAGLLLNQALSIASGFVLFLLVRRFTESPEIALLSCMFFYLYPTAGFLNFFYSESLFVFLLLLHLLLSERSRYKSAIAVGILLGLTRPQGILTVFWHLGRFLESPRSRLKRILCSLAPVLGFGIFWGYVTWSTGSPMSVFLIQGAHGREGDLGKMLHELLTPHGFSGQLYVVTIVIAVATLPWTAKCTKSFGFLAFGAAMLFLPLSTGASMSISRFLLGNIGQYVVLAHALAHYRLSWVIPLCFAVLQGIANAYLISWRWVA